jgi:glycosyltransferase involved in cell wall biosynthesis
MMDPVVTVVIPTIPPRAEMLERALASVRGQTVVPAAVRVAVATDTDHQGAAATRNRGLEQVTTPWTAFLDDDDVLWPEHLARLIGCAQETGADLVYPWFDVPGGWDPFPQYFGQPFDEQALRTVQNYIPVTVLVRTSLARAVGGFQALNASTEPGASPCEEWGCWLAMLDEGAQFVHLPERTWSYTWHRGNTSGRGDRW